jgi:hypothetical protein
MSCACGSDRQEQYRTEIAIHHKPRLGGISKRPVMVFPTVQICLDCGNAEFRMSEEQLSELDEEPIDDEKSA